MSTTGETSGSSTTSTVRELMGTGRPLTWVFAGDSITQGVQHTHGQRCWAEHVTERIRWGLGRPFDVCINTGIAGWTAQAVWRHLDHLVTRFAPDVVSVALGMNDCCEGPAGRAGFAEALGEIADGILELGTEARPVALVLHTPNTIATGSWNDPVEVGAYAGIVRELAAHTGAQLVDHHVYWSERFGGGTAWDWLDEPVHPNAAGHRAMAELTARTLGLDG